MKKITRVPREGGIMAWSKNPAHSPATLAAAQRIASREAGELEDDAEPQVTVAAFQSSI